jgi:hypothetical protein
VSKYEIINNLPEMAADKNVTGGTKAKKSNILSGIFPFLFFL